MNIWADMENAPHVHVLYPIIKELRSRGYNVEITARDYGQTIPLLDLYGLKYRAIGKHGGKNKLKKIISLSSRSINLTTYAVNKKFKLVFCHGSRSIYLPIKLLGIPLVALSDYEHTKFPKIMQGWASRFLMPDVISDTTLKNVGVDLSKVVKYPGLKEELYIYDFKPDVKLLKKLGIDDSKVIVVVRPPATMAHYHVEEGETLFWHIINYLITCKDLLIILLPRTANQLQEITMRLNNSYLYENLFILKETVHGPNLLWNSDLVISGGGTMNREAACLGIPVYSIYKGKLGDVDKHLIETGRLKMIDKSEMIKDIFFQKRDKKNSIKPGKSSKKLINYITDKILEIKT